MGYNSKQYLTHEETIANGIESARGTHNRGKERTTLAELWAWFDSLDAEQRDMLRYEFENQKNNNHDDND